MSSKLPILQSAFVAYLRNLNLQKRSQYLTEIALDADSKNLYWELAEHFNEWHPAKLAKLLDKNGNGKNGKNGNPKK